MYDELAANEPVTAVLGAARCLEAIGQTEKATDLLQQASKAHASAADLRGELSRLALNRGDYETAHEHAEASLKMDPEQLPARWVRAELLRRSGQLDDAIQAYQWFINYYNRQDMHDAEALRWVGLAAAQFARWNRLSDQFSFLVNELYPDALKIEPGFWPAHYEAGLLLAEKYNQADAARELQAAMALNANSAEIHAGLAALALQNYELGDTQRSIQRALDINPRLLTAHQLQSDLYLANLDLQKAVETLKGALQLQPKSEETLGRLAAAFAALDGQSDIVPGSRAAKIISDVTARNPHAGEFFMALGDSMDKLRRYPAAARFYEEAVRCMPRHAYARGQWGLMLMRLGEEPQAKKLLDESFEIDPFNVRVSNTLKVLELLDGYETLETQHFIIKFDPGKDKVTARYAAEWLEQVYPVLCQQFAFEPPQKSLFEIYNDAKNTDGHGWFSARMVGLPRIHTIGACAGKMVAMQSPNCGKQRFNWARVLKHEFVHVINLQQTHFNIPHWYTEALAVLNEGADRPQAWNELLIERVPQGKTFNLDTINLGFIRPHSSDDWTMAYCQAELYAEYLLETYGADALAKMLSAYADNLSTSEALRRSFGVEQAEFERGYGQHLQKIVATLPKPRGSEKRSVEQIRKALSTDEGNPDLLAKLAQAELSRRAYAEARRLADAALKVDPRQQLAAYVRARLHLLVGENEQAVALLERCFDPGAPQGDLLALLAGIKFKAEEYAEAARLYELGAKHNPTSDKWAKSLAQVYLKSGDEPKLAEILAGLAARDSDNLPVRKKLVELAIARGDYQTAGSYARQAIQVDVSDPAMHRLLADSLAKEGQTQPAIEEYEVSLEIDADQPDTKCALAGAYLRSGEPDKARRTLESVLDSDPSHAQAKQLLESLNR